MHHLRSRGERIFHAFNVVLLGIVGLLAVYPFLYVLTLSFSTAAAVARGGLQIVPEETSLAAYRMVLSDPDIRVGYINSLGRTVIGTALSLLVTAIAAYPLSRKQMPWRRQMIFLVLGTMLFSGGLVPTYLWLRDLGFMNNRLVLIVPTLLTAFNIIILKNFFQGIPESLAESARMDGANDLTILFRIFIPLSKPALATIALWTAVSHWNAWFDAMIYITSDDKQVLQVFLQRIVVENTTEGIEAGVPSANAVDFAHESIKAATVVITVLPILCVYPFVQRYFVRGIMLGGIKE